MKRVVVTGLGMISPLANNVEESWERLLNGECGILKIQSYDASEMPVQIAAEVKILILWTLELRKKK
ncbi:3-oxoacyl-[acyl-carrier-protein] synthase 2 [Fusobacterium necrophorum subsp. necrophorum]|nr:3-oxoacyl-[acyl-carrier-protein] synthase 2 [Fusobacterium necrophorum subsp. necrophorum]